MSRNAKFFITVVVAAGLLAAAVTLAQAEWRSGQKLQFILCSVLAILSSRMKVGLPGVTETLSVNFVFILLSAVELPRVDTLLISCAAPLAQSLWSAKTRLGLIKIAFNLGNAALCGVICSIVYGSPVVRRMNSSLPVLLFCASVSYFVVIGLARENLTRIFAHGFATKPHGHGFGLHSGALAAKQMGGTLSVESDGPGRGAVFTLELPLAAQTVSAAMGMPSDRRFGDRPQGDETGRSRCALLREHSRRAISGPEPATDDRCVFRVVRRSVTSG
jgi:hypothetical protein